MQEAFLVIFNWILEVYLKLYVATTEYEIQLEGIQRNFNNAVSNAFKGAERIWTKQSRRQRRTFARREERKRGVSYYDVDVDIGADATEAVDAAAHANIKDSFDVGLGEGGSGENSPRTSRNYNDNANLPVDSDVTQLYLSAYAGKIQLGIGNKVDGVLTTLDVKVIDARVTVKPDHIAVKATVDSLVIHNFTCGLYPDILRSIGDRQLVNFQLEV